MIVPILGGSLANRAPGQPISGIDVSGSPGADAALAFYQQRVAQHPDDVAARLDLADHYLQAGAVPAAVTQYQQALALDPRNPEALATLGFLVATAGHADQGLEFIQRALAADPTLPRGPVLRGFRRAAVPEPSGGRDRGIGTYLDAAPFGARRDAVQRLLTEAQGQLLSPPPTSSP